MDGNLRGPGAFAGALAAMSALSAASTQKRPPGRRLIQVPGQITRQGAPVGRNDPCPCGSGKKFKKCHGGDPSSYRRDPDMLPKAKTLPDAEVKEAAESTEAPANKNATAIAMMNAGISPRLVWAYLECGAYVTELNKKSHPPETVEKWRAALEQYDNATEDERKIFLAPATL